MAVKSNKAAFKTEQEAIDHAEYLNRTRYKRSRIGVRVLRMSPWWVIVGCSKSEVAK